MPSLSAEQAAGHELSGSTAAAVPLTARTGLGANLWQFGLLIIVTAFVGGLVGSERTILPIIAQSSFGIASHAAALAFIATFGMSKAAINLFAGGLSDRFGRRNCLLAGWVIGVPVPLLIMLAPDWSWVILANVLLGINQALTWSMTVNMKLDLARPHERGLAIGLNEFAGYSGVALLAFVTGYLAQELGAPLALRTVPFYLSMGLVLAGLGLSLLMRDTRAIRDAQQEQSSPSGSDSHQLRLIEVFRLGTWRSAQLSGAGLAGLATNLKDGMLWGLLPIFLTTSRGLGIAQTGLVVAVYPATWGILQLIAGPLSDRVSRKALISVGLGIQAAGVWAFVSVSNYAGYLAAAVLVGLGTALVYPTLQAYVSDVAAPSWRASGLGVYRFWRDMGYVVGALGAGAVADALGIDQAFTMVAALTALVSITFALRSRDGTHGTHGTHGVGQAGINRRPDAT